MSPARERITDALRVLLATGGPLSAVLLRHTGMKQDDIDLIFQLVLLAGPPLGAWVWGLYLNTIEKKVQAIAQQAPHVQAEALNKISDADKVRIVESIPEVATVVVKDNARNGLQELALSTQHPNIVTETQNEFDAKQGTKVK